MHWLTHLHVSLSEPFSLSAEVQKSQLITESWYHGAISRPVAESLLKCDGDFLVRESQGTPGQYVLSGMQTTTTKHLLLIDPEGVVSPNQINLIYCVVIPWLVLSVSGANEGPCVREHQSLNQLPLDKLSAHYLGRERPPATDANYTDAWREMKN